MWKHFNLKEKNEIKAKYREMYIELEKIVNEWDPIGLIEGGAPDNEYDCITTQLIKLLNGGATKETIYEFIIYELDDHFGMGINSVRQEYREHYILVQRQFADRVIEWYSGLNK